MYLYRWHCHVKNGQWRQFMDIMKAVNRMHEERGYTPLRFFSGVVGKANFFVAHSEFPNLAAWEEEMDRISQDGQLMDLLRSSADYMAETETHELLMEAPEIA